MNIDRRKILSAAGAIAGISAVSTVPGASVLAASPKVRIGSGHGLIAMQEAFLPSGLVEEWEAAAGTPFSKDLKQQLQDLTGKRLEEMDACHIDVAVTSIAGPLPQLITDPAKANATAKRANDALAQEISKKPDRFIGFGSLSMHDPEEATRELQRAVGDLGMRGVLLHGFQRALNEQKALFYDDRRYDGFWATLEQLDVPFYLSPGLLRGDLAGRDRDLTGDGYPWLDGAEWAYGINTGRHALRIITCGILDRHPRIQLILGHNGEQVVNDLFRIDNWVNIGRTEDNTPMKKPYGKNVRDYFRSNVHVTTSGTFSTPALRHVIEEIGADRVMFAVEYPSESNIEGTRWFQSAELDAPTRAAIGRSNAARLLKLA